MTTTSPPPRRKHRETDTSARVRLEVSRRGGVVWRNNSGVATNHAGQPVRFGLANDSANLNARIKSSDLIGWTADGRFLAIECKRPGWKYTGTKREQAQLRFIQAVIAAGGCAGFASCVEDVTIILDTKK